MKPELRARIVTGFAGAILIGIAIQNAWGWRVLIAVVGIIAALELQSIVAKFDIKLETLPLVSAPILFCLLPANSAWEWQNLVTACGIAIILTLLQRGTREKLVLGASMAYTALLLSRTAMIRIEPNGIALTAILVGIVWGTDTVAYFGGTRFGKWKPKWLSRLSPKKTVEGIVFGFIGGVSSLIVTDQIPGAPKLGPALIAVVLITATVAQLGDWFESGLKREAKVKDSGDLLPGHGGVLDRFDSLIAAGAVFWLLLPFIR